MIALGGVCCFASYALDEVVAAKHKGPEVDIGTSWKTLSIKAQFNVVPA
jgi:hypothetical protein